MKWKKLQIIILSLIPLFLIIPFLFHLELLMKGKITTGIVSGKKTVTVNEFYADIATHTEVTFSTPSATYILYGPDNYILPKGTYVKVIYHPDNPTNCQIYKWFVLYLNPFLIITFILELFLFIAYWYLRYEYKSKDFSRF